MAGIDDRTLESIIRRGVAEIISEEEFVDLLKAGKPLRLKMGFDPSRPDIHLGHVVGLRKLRQLQELGHQVILIVGDWTAQIGDPSGQSATRPMLSADEVRANAETYMRQFFKIVDKERTQAVWQSEWFGKFGLADVIRLANKFTVAQFLAREDFGNRFREGRPIAITELLYPLLQAYDSVAIQADVEFGGTDQRFNLLVGRELQAMVGQRPQQCFLMPLLVGTDGAHKMSKSLGNYIAVEDPPNDMYGKVMSLPDRLIMDYFQLLTDVPDEEVAGLRRQLDAGTVNPMLPKKRLAREIVGQFHSSTQAEEAESYFERVVQKGALPAEVDIFSLDSNALAHLIFGEKVTALHLIENLNKIDLSPQERNELNVLKKIHLDEGPWTPQGLEHAVLANEALKPTFRQRLMDFVSSSEAPGVRVPAEELLVEMGLTPSKSEARRLLASGAVYVDGEQVRAESFHATLAVKDGSVIRVGRRRFKKLAVE